MPILKAERLTALKAKVKAEMLRRSQSGSVAAYGGAGYDYASAPGPGKVTRQEHLDKLSGPMSAVNADAVPGKTGPRVVSEAELVNMETRVDVWAARSMTDRSGSDCKAGCTGTCYTGCATGCYGCSGCSGCGSGCASGCSGCDGCSGCGSGCPNGCSACSDGCASGCGELCSTGCYAACELGCYTGCNGCSGCGSGCPNSCSACSDGCATGCVAACQLGCYTGCNGCSGNGN